MKKKNNSKNVPPNNKQSKPIQIPSTEEKKMEIPPTVEVKQTKVEEKVQQQAPPVVQNKNSSSRSDIVFLVILLLFAGAGAWKISQEQKTRNVIVAGKDAEIAKLKADLKRAEDLANQSQVNKLKEANEALEKERASLSSALAEQKTLLEERSSSMDDALKVLGVQLEEMKAQCVFKPKPAPKKAGVVSIKPPKAHNLSFSTKKNQIMKGELKSDNAAKKDYSVVSLPVKGKLELQKNTGSFVYTPNKDAVGEDSFDYVVKSGSLTSSVAKVKINIEDVIIEKKEIIIINHIHVQNPKHKGIIEIEKIKPEPKKAKPYKPALPNDLLK